MPGIDFDVLRVEITIGRVLDLLGFEPSSASGDPLGGLARYMDRRRTRADPSR